MAKLMNADDVIAVEELQHFYEQAYGTGQHLVEAPSLFCLESEAELHTHASRGGFDAIKAQYVEYYDGTPLYDTYHCGQQICTPVVEVDGDEAHGQFPTSSFFINDTMHSPAEPEPIKKPPYTVNSTFEMWFHDFKRERGLWKILNFHFAGLVSFGMTDPFWRWDPSDDGLAARGMLHNLWTPFPVMKYVADRMRFEVNAPAPVRDVPVTFEDNWATLEYGSQVPTDLRESRENPIRPGGAQLMCSEYYGVQFIQGHYLVRWECKAFDEIVPKLFASSDDISVSYEDEGLKKIGLGAAAGRAAVTEFFKRAALMSEVNGGLLRVDLPHTQKITVSGDGQSACGTWETMSMQVMGPAFGGDAKVADMDYRIGRFENQYVLEDGLWKIKSVSWKPLIAFGDWQTKDASAVYGRPYPKPIETVSAVDDDAASDKALANIRIRNKVMTFFSDFNRIGLEAIDGRFSEDAARGARKMLTAPCVIRGLEKSGEDQDSFAGAASQGCFAGAAAGQGCFAGAAMVTSPIVNVERPDRAQIYVNAGRIMPVDSGNIAHSRGRVLAEMKLVDGAWIFDSFEYYRYATMMPWKVREVF